MGWRHLDPWTASQQRGLIAILILVTAALAIRLAINGTTVPDTWLWQGPLASQLADHIDPNTASVAQLSAIPTLGEKRAQQIVDFRRQYVAQHPGRLAYARLDDLQRIKGIGAATVESLEPYLVFPSAPSSRP